MSLALICTNCTDMCYVCYNTSVLTVHHIMGLFLFYSFTFFFTFFFTLSMQSVCVFGDGSPGKT